MYNIRKRVKFTKYDNDHIIFINVVSNKNTDFQLYIFWGVKFNNNIMFQDMREKTNFG